MMFDNRVIHKGEKMKFLLKVSIPNVEGNLAAKSGTLITTIAKILEDLKPESAYFSDENGMRTGYLFVNMNDSSEIPKIAEPWFQASNSGIDILPSIGFEDLKKSNSFIDSAVEKYS